MSFVRYNTDDSVISSETVVRGMWTADTASLTAFFTSSLVTSSYHLNVYDTSTTSSLQFAIQYGHLNGSGSSDINSAVADITPTRITYGQYRSLIYNDENSSFNFGGITSKDFFALNIARSRFKESIKPGSLALKLSGSSGGLTTLTLTDDSITNGSVTNFIGSNRYYTLISGSTGTAATSLAGISGSYGLLFPDLGVILLNPYAVSQSIKVNPTRAIGTTNGLNNTTLYTAINKGKSFTINSQETITSDYIFVRSRNSEFNYSENPSFISGSTGEVIYSNFINNPQTYVTTVGLYNDSNELLAVAKLSRPLVKDFTKESLIRVKLDF